MKSQNIEKPLILPIMISHLSMNSTTKYNKWSDDDKLKLINLVRACKNPNGSVNWAAVTRGLPGRSQNQCHSMFSNTLRHTVEMKNNAKWSQEESIRLLVLVRVFGKRWAMFQRQWFQKREKELIRQKFIYLNHHQDLIEKIEKHDQSI